MAGVRNAPAARTTVEARTTRRRLRLARRHVRLDPDRAAALGQDAGHVGVGHDPGARRVRRREVDADPGLLGAPRTPERTAAAVPAGARVPARRGGLPAERPGPAQDDGVLGRDVGGLGDADLRLDRRDVVVPRLPGQALEAVLGRPFGSRTPSGAGMQVVQLMSVPPPTPVPASSVTEPSQVVTRP